MSNMNITTSSIFRFFLVALLFFLIYYLRDVILVILTSIIIASFVHIVADRMTKYRFNHTLSVVLVYALSVALVSGLFYLFAPVFINEIADFSNVVSGHIPNSNILSNLQGDTIKDAREIVADISNNAALPSIIESIKSFSNSFSGSLLESLSVAFGGFVNLILIFVLSFYLSIEEKGIEGFLRIIIPASHEDYAVDLWIRAKRKIALWIRGQLVLGLLVGVLIYLGLSILGVKYALLLSMLSAILELIPFGIVLAVIPAVIFAYLDGGLTLGLMVGGFYLIVHQFEAYLIQPLLIKKTVGISPLVVIISILVGFQLAGFWGVILGVPVAVSLLEFTDDIEKEKIQAKKNV